MRHSSVSFVTFQTPVTHSQRVPQLLIALP